MLDLGDTIYTSTESYKQFETLKGYSKEKVRPITWVEIMYISTYFSCYTRHVHVTRYPVIGDGSTYPSKIHLCSTIPGRVVHYKSVFDEDVWTFPEYPILGNAYQDTVQVGFDRLDGLGADFDGDTVSVNGVLSEEANEECKRYLESSLALISTQRKLVIGGLTKTAKLTLYNWTL